MKNTAVTFKDGQELIVHHDHDFTADEMLQLEALTSKEFKSIILSTRRFKTIPIKDNPYLKSE